MVIYAPGIAKEAKPGQFVHLRCQDSTEPFLRRPFSFHEINHKNFAILYRVIGQGTNLLAKKRKGDLIDVLGPLGNGFDITPATSDQRLATILVAGGMGVAPLLALAERLSFSVERIAERDKIIVLLGAKTKAAVLCEKDFRKLGLKVKIATDDGSKGYKGLVTDLLKKVLKGATSDQRRATIYACGPQPMFKELARISRGLRISVQASLEENMACGVGACLGCPVETKAGYKQVCKDGPIFNLREIQW